MKYVDSITITLLLECFCLHTLERNHIIIFVTVLHLLKTSESVFCHTNRAPFYQFFLCTVYYVSRSMSTKTMQCMSSCNIICTCKALPLLMETMVSLYQR